MRHMRGSLHLGFPSDANMLAICFYFSSQLSFSHDRCHKWVSDSDMMAVMGKVEGQGESWHGHVTAVTVAPEYRRQQLAKKLMNLLEDFSDKM